MACCGFSGVGGRPLCWEAGAVTALLLLPPYVRCLGAAVGDPGGGPGTSDSGGVSKHGAGTSEQWQKSEDKLQSSHRDIKCSIGNMVNNTGA